MAIQDPYPTDLDEMPFTPIDQTLAPDPLVAAVNRLAQAVEQNTLALLHPLQPVQNAPRAATGGFVSPDTTRAGLAPLPPVTVVANRPACPLHGPDKVAPSRNGPGFYCQSKAAPGQPANPKGYCVWHT